MMRPFSRTGFFSLIAMGIIPFSPLSMAQQDDTAAMQSRESARRQARLREARQEVQEARLAYQAKRYTLSEEHYRRALSLVEESPATQEFVRFVKDSLSDALIARAIDYRAVGRTDEAVSFLKEAVELSPKNGRAKAELVYTADPERTNPALTPEHVGDVEEVNRLLTLAYGYYDLGRYDQAISTFEQVLRIDKYNTAAQRGIEQATKRKSGYYQAARTATRSSMLSDVDSLWDMNRTKDAPEELPAEDSTFSPGLDRELQDAYAGRLEEMVLPSIVFDEATITDVIEALQNQISRFESANGLRAGRHINITTNFGTADTPAYKELMAKTFSIELNQVSVKDVLDILIKQLGINYYYTSTGVELSYSGRDFGPLLERTFSVPPYFFDPSKEDAEETSDTEDEEGAFIKPGSKLAVRRVNPVEVLKGMGVSFPAGATARYSAASRQLHVRNTAHNLEMIQELLNVPMEADRQIVLNVIVVEVSEDDLEQLGFDWMLNMSLGGSSFLSGGLEDAASTVTGVPTFKGELQPDSRTPFVTQSLRSGKGVVSVNSMDRLISQGSVAGFSGDADEKAPGIFGIRGVWSSADVTMLMRGFSQKKGVDILQNPRLIMTPGSDEQAVFANVTEIFFPETWEQGQIVSTSSDNDDDRRPYPSTGAASSLSSGITIASGALPQDFVRFGMTEDAIGGIGTILQVHSAEISENGQYVTLALTTTTNEFEGFINWGSPLYSAIWSGSNEIQTYELTPNYILQPMIKRYVENTKVTVVPGTVLVMGGLKEAKYVRFEDKVPVLGDLPMVGRLFRSEGEEKVRKALLYFARVDVIDPTGRDVATGERPSMATDNL